MIDWSRLLVEGERYRASYTESFPVALEWALWAYPEAAELVDTDRLRTAR